MVFKARFPLGVY